MNSILLWLVALFNPFFERLGVNTGQLNAILRCKLMVDDRSPSALSGSRKSGGRHIGILRTVIITFFGLLAMAILFISEQPFIAHTIYFTVFMFMISSMLITDFTHVLIDVRDNYTILPRPVNDSTISIARILHICLHLSKVVIPLGFGGLAYTLITKGLASGGIFFVELLSATLFCVFTVNATYLLMLKLMRPEKFRDALVYFQVGFMVILLTSYYIVPKVIDFEQINTIRLADYWFNYLLPPFWISGLHELSVGNFNEITITLSALAMFMPLLCIILVIKYLAPDFNKKIALIGISGQVAKENTAEPTENTLAKSTYSEKLAEWTCNSTLERASFMMTWRLSGRIREFKANSYPSFAFIPCYFIYFMFNGDKNLSFAEKWRDLPNGNSYLFLIYLICLLSIIVLQQVTRCDQYKASWVYQVSPSKHPGEILMGTFKAVLCKYHFPALIAVLIFVFAIWGFGIGLNVLLAIVNILLISVVFAYHLTRNFAFSQPNKLSDQTGKMFLYMVFALIPVGIGFLHNFLVQWTWVIVLFTAVSVPLTWYYFRKYAQLGWDKIG